MTPEVNEALVNLAVAVVIALSTALTALIGVWTQRLRTKIQSEKATEYLGLLEDLTRNTVEAVQQTIVGDLKTAGKLDQYTAEKVKTDAIQSVLAQLGAAKTVAARKVLGDLEEIVDQMLESQVFRMKTWVPTRPPDIGADA